MDNLIGRLTAELAEKDAEIPETLLEKINRNIAPPERVTAEMVHIRAMYIVSDRVNSFGGCFPVEEHEKLAALLIDSPVLVGHRKDSLPIARNFHAERTARGNANWIKVYFYWLKDSADGEEIRKNIDGGIYKECSISFIFGLPECSICGNDMRDCRHQPFAEYETGGVKKVAHFNYRKIEKVLETSLVYRGSVENTSLTNELAFTKVVAGELENPDRHRLQPLQKLWDITKVPPDERYLALPAYESLKAHLYKRSGALSVTYPDGTPLDSELLVPFLNRLKLPTSDFAVEVSLIGYRGKERQLAADVASYLVGGHSPVRRLEMKVFDILEEGSDNVASEDGAHRRKRLERLFSRLTALLAPATAVSYSELSQVVDKIATRCGVEIYSANGSERFLFTYRRSARFKVAALEQFSRGFRYRLSGVSQGQTLPVNNIICSTHRLAIGDICEIETAGVNLNGDSIELKHPRITALAAAGSGPDELRLIASESVFRRRYAVTALSRNRTLIDFRQTDGPLLLSHCSPDQVQQGGWLLADRYDNNSRSVTESGHNGTVLSRERCGEGYRFSLEGYLKGNFILRPVRIKGMRKFLFYRREEGRWGDIRNEI
ncbi:MAG: hypothetical protein HRF51_04370 [bacterium]|jgi:hypothetical protein